jgi:hypothetical protein
MTGSEAWSTQQVLIGTDAAALAACQAAVAELSENLQDVEDVIISNKDVLPTVSTGVYNGLRNANAVVGKTFSYSRESTSSTYRCGYIAVEEGDVLTITMNSGSYYRTCVLLDSNNVVTWTSGQGNTSNRVVTIPSGSVRFAFNYDSTKTVVLKKKVTIDDTVEELVATMPTKADKSILAGITPKAFTPSNTNHTWNYSNGVLAVTTNVAGAGYAESADMPSHTKPWTLTFKARMINGNSQTLNVGLCSSSTGNDTKAITINSAEWTNFNINGTGGSSYNLGFAIPAARAIVGNVFEIKDIVMMSDYVKIPINTLERLDALDEEVGSKITTRTWEVSCNNGINALYVGLRNANAVVGNTFSYSTENSGYSSGYIDVESGDVVNITLTSLNSSYYRTAVVLDSDNKITRVLGVTYSGTITIASNEVRIAYSCARTSNDKFVITRQLVNVVEELIEEVENKAASAYGKVFTFNTDAFLQGCDRYSKYLIKIGCCGDSLTANAIGGNIPSDVDEGSAQTRPMRLLTNGIPRRLYDMISWNKPIWRRLDHSAWSRSGFTYQYYDLFNGINPGYWQSTSAGSYAQITVPQGYEHFALVCRQMSGGGTLNVTINGQAPSTYPNPYYDSRVETNTIVTADVVPPTLPIGVSAIDLTSTSSRGNFYHIVQFNNLPSGQANVIKFETASAAQCDIWGGFYWSGNTCVVMNLGHGGHTSSELISKWMTAEVYNENYDAILFEVPEMNNTRLSIDQTKADITSISDRLRGMNVDHCFTSCNILGLSIVHDTNFYDTSPTQLEINDAVRELLSSLGEPFIDIFQYFRWHTERRGGTLAGGQAGLWYTEDGQHGNPAGVKLWFDCLKKAILNKAIMIE